MRQQTEPIPPPTPDPLPEPPPEPVPDPLPHPERRLGLFASLETGEEVSCIPSAA
jgi:hypothetical protein